MQAKKVLAANSNKALICLVMQLINSSPAIKLTCLICTPPSDLELPNAWHLLTLDRLPEPAAEPTAGSLRRGCEGRTAQSLTPCAACVAGLHGRSDAAELTDAIALLSHFECKAHLQCMPQGRLARPPLKEGALRRRQAQSVIAKLLQSIGLHLK